MHIPNKGDIIYLDFDPSLGHEQGGLRPAIVLSGIQYNNSLGLCITVPVTSKEKGYIFEVKLGMENKTRGVVLTDQIKCIDWRSRKIKFIEQLYSDTLEKVLAKSRSLLE